MLRFPWNCVLGFPPLLGTDPAPAAAKLSQEAIVICASDHLQQSTLTAKFRKEEKKEVEGEKDKTEASSIPVGT